ncbi:Hypothetical protein D9617_89g071750 [Elsinoe fawcettii]|nr:Hypothetical protein D9617_89g071750 [Elsinoe fawcettii]
MYYGRTSSRHSLRPYNLAISPPDAQSATVPRRGLPCTTRLVPGPVRLSPRVYGDGEEDLDFRLWPSTWLASYLSGVFPQILTLPFVYFSPVVIRRLIVLRRCGSTRSRDLSSANYLFTYLFFQVFVFVSFSTTMTAVLPLIVEKPGEVPELFSVNLPKAGNYFISYIIVQGLTLTVTNLLDWKYLLEKFIFSRFRAMTMRQQLVTECPSDLDWVILFPTTTLLAIIGRYS